MQCNAGHVLHNIDIIRAGNFITKFIDLIKCADYVLQSKRDSVWVIKSWSKCWQPKSYCTQEKPGDNWLSMHRRRSSWRRCWSPTRTRCSRSARPSSPPSPWNLCEWRQRLRVAEEVLVGWTTEVHCDVWLLLRCLLLSLCIQEITLNNFQIIILSLQNCGTRCYTCCVYHRSNNNVGDMWVICRFSHHFYRIILA